MGLFDWLRRNHSRTSGRAKALTPREIQELHAKLYPESHTDSTWTHREVLRDPRLPKPDLSRTFDGIEREFLRSGNMQSQSLLFSRLPTEIRREIWSHALGGHRFALAVRNGRLRVDVRPGRKWSQTRQLLDIVCVCRAVYLESITILYSTNIFCVGIGAAATYQPLTLLDSFLPPKYIASLRHVELGWHTVLGVSQYYDSHPQAWNLTSLAPEPVQKGSRLWQDVCEQLAALPNLASLKIIVWASGNQRTQLVDYEEEFTAPLENLKEVLRFQVTLPWGPQDSVVWQDGESFIARRYADDERFGLNTPVLEGLSADARM